MKKHRTFSENWGKQKIKNKKVNNVYFSFLESFVTEWRQKVVIVYLLKLL